MRRWWGKPRASIADESARWSTPPGIRDFFNKAAADEEHYPSTIDPRIYHVKLILEHLGDLRSGV